jgi:hypothetical protein
MIKYSTLLLLTILLFVTNGYAQNQVEEIVARDGIHYITTSIDYPIIGTYLFEGETEPIVQLNPNGTGVFQLHDLSKIAMVWGIECFKDGTPIYQKGFNYAVYTLWYKSNEQFAETDAKNNWINAHFSIHFEKKKMFILGERSKDYVE